MKKYRITYGYEDGAKHQIDIDATSKVDAMLAMKRSFGNQIYVSKVEEFAYCDDEKIEMAKADLKIVRDYDKEYSEGQRMVKIPMTDEEVKKRIKEAIENGKSHIREADIKNEKEMLLYICKRLKNIYIDMLNAENNWRDEEPGSKLPELEDVLEELEEYLDVKDTLYWGEIDE